VTNGKQTQLLSSHMQDWPLCHLNESESDCRGDIHTLSIALIGSCMIAPVLMLQSSLQDLLPWLVFTTKITCNKPHHCIAIKMCLSITWRILVLHPGILWWHEYQNIVRSSSTKLKSLAVSQHLINRWLSQGHSWLEPAYQNFRKEQSSNKSRMSQSDFLINFHTMP
jgi:hypothetical protein